MLRYNYSIKREATFENNFDMEVTVAEKIFT